MKFEDFGKNDKIADAEQQRLMVSRSEFELLKEHNEESHGWAEYMKGFDDLYFADSIKRDISYVEGISNSEDFKAKPVRADILEYIINNYADQSSWFGNGVLAKCSRYDDYANGVDGILEFRIEDDQIVRLAIDVTVTKNKNVIYDKKGSIERALINGAMSSVKYFTSSEEVDDDGEEVKKQINGIPKIILCIPEDETVQELAEIIKGKGLSKKDATEALSKHTSHLILLRDVQIQMIWQTATLLHSFMEKLGAIESYSPQDAELINTFIERIQETKIQEMDSIKVLGLLDFVQSNLDDLNRITDSPRFERLGRRIIDGLIQIKEIIIIFQNIVEEKREQFDEETFNQIFNKKTSIAEVIEEGVERLDSEIKRKIA